MSDHRIGFTGNGVDRYLNATPVLDELIEALVGEDEKQKLEHFLKTMISKSDAVA